MNKNNKILFKLLVPTLAFYGINANAMENAKPIVPTVAQPDAQQNEKKETMKLRDWLNELEPNKQGVEQLAKMISKLNEIINKESKNRKCYDTHYGRILTNTVVIPAKEDPTGFSIKIGNSAYCYNQNKWEIDENNLEALRKVVNGAKQLKPLWEKIIDAHQAVSAVNEYRKTKFPDWHGSPKATKEDYFWNAPGREFRNILNSLGWMWSFDNERISKTKHGGKRENAKNELAYRLSVLSRMIPEKE